MKWPESITVCEVGPRDGLQNEETQLSVDQKVALIEGAVASGIRVIEVGSFVHPKAVPQMAETGDVVRKMRRVDGVEYRALVANLKGVERAFDAGLTKVKLTVSASESHSLANLKKKPEEILDGFRECVDFADKNGMNISGAISTAFGCPFEGKVSQAQVEKIAMKFLDLGVRELSLSDTTGMGNPRQVFELSSYMKQKFPLVKWVLHLHNTRGMALANIVAGMQAGISWYDASFAGLGGCPFAPGASGNVATEDVLHMAEEMGIETGVCLDKAIAVARQAQEYVGHSTESFVLKAGRCCDLIARSEAKKQ